MQILLDESDIVVAFTPVGPFGMNQSIVGCKKTGHAALIDSGDAPDRFLAFAKSRGLTITKLLQTHAHIDHVAGLAATKRAIDAPLYLHPLDQPVYDLVPQQGRAYGFPVEALPLIDIFYEEGDLLAVGDLVFRVLHTPGHAPGHVCLLNDAHNLMIGGDLLFRESIGRTDLPGANHAHMMESLKRVAALPEATRVLPGHMEPTTIGYERQYNPFLRDLT